MFMMELTFPLTDHLVGSAFSLPSIFQIDCRSHAIIWAFQFLLTVADNSYAFCIQQPLIPFFFLKVCLSSVLCGFRNYGTASRALLDSKRNIARTCEGAKALLVQWVYHPSPHQLSLSSSPTIFHIASWTRATLASSLVPVQGGSLALGPVWNSPLTSARLATSPPLNFFLVVCLESCQFY